MANTFTNYHFDDPKWVSRQEANLYEVTEIIDKYAVLLGDPNDQEYMSRMRTEAQRDAVAYAIHIMHTIEEGFAEYENPITDYLDWQYALMNANAGAWDKLRELIYIDGLNMSKDRPSEAPDAQYYDQQGQALINMASFL